MAKPVSENQRMTLRQLANQYEPKPASYWRWGTLIALEKRGLVYLLRPPVQDSVDWWVRAHTRAVITEAGKAVVAADAAAEIANV